MLRGLIQISSFPQSWFHPIAIAGTYPHRGKYIFRVRDPGCASFFWGGGGKSWGDWIQWTSWIQSKHTQIAKFTKSISSVRQMDFQWITFVGRQVFHGRKSQLFPTWIPAPWKLWQIKPRKIPQKSWFNPGSFKWTGLFFSSFPTISPKNHHFYSNFLDQSVVVLSLGFPFFANKAFKILTSPRIAA